MKKELVMLIFIMLLLGAVSAQLDTGNQRRLEFGHVVIIKDLKTEPSQIVPGSPSMLKGTIFNNGNKFVNDVVIELKVPNEIGFFNDVSTKKISTLLSGEASEFEFKIIALPNAAEGVYKANLVVQYVNHIGEKRENNDTTSIIVKGIPSIYTEVENSEIYSGNKIGNVDIKIVNNDVANVKFLTVQIENSKDYDIISSNKDYVADLNSDDFETVSFKLKSKKSFGEIKIPLTLKYKDALNNDYTKSLEVSLPLRSASDVGKSNNTIWYVISLIVVGIIIYYIYRKYKKRKKLAIKF